MKKNIKQLVLTVLVVTIFSFLLLYKGLGNPVNGMVDSLEYQDIGQSQMLTEQYGLDKPLAIQYFIWLKNIFLGDWGRSYVDGQPVIIAIGERIPATLILTVPAFVLGFILAVVLGVAMALYRDTWFDYVIHGLMFTLWSTPAFLLSMLLLQVLSFKLNLLPSGGISSIGRTFSISESWTYMIMPVGVLSTYSATSLIGIIRSQMISVLNQDYIKTACACGIARRRIIFVYSLKNALLPLITAAAMSIPRFFSGAFVIEFVFSWPGMGRLIIDAAYKRDYPVLLAEVLIISFVVIISNMIGDTLYHLADPRIKAYDHNKEQTI